MIMYRRKDVGIRSNRWMVICKLKLTRYVVGIFHAYRLKNDLEEQVKEACSLVVCKNSIIVLS